MGKWMQPAQAHARCIKCNSPLGPSVGLPIIVLLYTDPLLCSFNVPIKGLIEQIFVSLDITYVISENCCFNYEFRNEMIRNVMILNTAWQPRKKRGHRYLSGHNKFTYWMALLMIALVIHTTVGHYC